MITTLHIHNFQAHKDLEIHLDPHVTTIVGPSDVGKSAIIRALRWVCFNRPNGDAFIRHGASETWVKLVFDKQALWRAKGKGKNRYSFGPDYFEAFGNEVPPPIATALNVAEINFQAQHDSPFWFSETAGEVSRRLNEIINLGLIDTVLSWLNSQARECNARISMCEERRDAAKQEISSLKVYQGLDNELCELEHKEKGLVNFRTSLTLLAGLIGEGQRLEAQAARAAALRQAAQAAAIKGEAWAGLAGRRDALTRLCEDGAKLAQQAGRVIPNIAPLERLHKRWQEREEERAALAKLHLEGAALMGAIAAADVALEQDKQDFKKGFGEVCPLCGQTAPR